MKTDEELLEAEAAAWKVCPHPYYTGLPTEHGIHYTGFMAGVEFARRTPGPATAALMALCRRTIDEGWVHAPGLELCHAFLREQGAAKEVEP